MPKKNLLSTSRYGHSLSLNHKLSNLEEGSKSHHPFFRSLLGGKLLLSHVHPYNPPGKTLFQAVHRETGVRIDVFRAYGFELERAVPFTIADCELKMVSLQDLVARHARLNWDLLESKPIDRKQARDFVRLLEYVTAEEIEAIWQEHRKPYFLGSLGRRCDGCGQ